MNKNIFREYDIRGVYPIDLNEDVYFEIGNAIASKCNQLNIESICADSSTPTSLFEQTVP